MPTNPVALAIERLGGLTRATVQTGKSTGTWCRWRRQGYIDDAAVLLQVAKMTDLDPITLAKSASRQAAS